MPDVRQTITDFYRVAQERDFSRDFHFRVLSIDAGDSGGISFDEDDLVYVKSASLPGRSIQNKPVPYMGMNFNVPGTVQYDGCLLYTSPSPRDGLLSRMPSSA